MGQYKADAEKLLKYVGGKQNIAAVTHCATRLRFVLNDESLADKEAIEDLDSVKGMFTNAGQFQVIIGNDVSSFYNDFTVVSGIEGVSKEQTNLVAKQNMSVMQRIIGVFAEIFAPIIPAIIVGGLILGFRNILGDISFAGSTIVERSVFWQGVYDFLWLPGEAIFHFLPVMITWSIARKMGTTQVLGIVLGITLVSPQLLNAYDMANGTVAPFWDFGFAQVSMVGYQAQVIPAMLAGFMLVYLEKFFRKHIPESVSMIFVPLLSLLPTILMAHVVLGPIGWWLGNGISHIVNAGLTSSVSWLFSFVFGALYAPLVITGLHHMSNAIDLQLIATFGSTSLWPMIALSNIAQGSAVLAVIYLHRGNKKEEQVSIPATISCYLGVTEPAMFGINLKYVYPFVAAMIGSGLAGMFSNIMNVQASAIGVGGLPGILAITSKIGGGYVAFGIAMVIAMIVPFVLTIIFRQRGIFNKIDPVDEATGVLYVEEEAAARAATTATDVYAPATGKFVALANVDDPVFSQKLMGDGFAVRPETGQVYAPVRGRVTSIFNTQHAIGLLTDNGAEVLVHMGIDTVELKGVPFSVKVKEGDIVTADTLLAEMDLDVLATNSKASDIMVVITNSEQLAQLSFDVVQPVQARQTIGSVKMKV